MSKLLRYNSYMESAVAHPIIITTELELHERNVCIESEEEYKVFVMLFTFLLGKILFFVKMIRKLCME